MQINLGERFLLLFYLPGGVLCYPCGGAIV